MSFNQDQQIDADEALRMLELSLNRADNIDVVMSIESKGNQIEGESPRVFADGKKRMAVLGYFAAVRADAAPGGTKSKLTLNAMLIVRRCDAATASIANLIKSQASDVSVLLSCFKASGDSSPGQESTLEIALEEARLSNYALVTGGSVGVPCEILAFAYRRMVIASAPQLKDGRRGAVRGAELG
ncbi:type VI secretion system tube protein Hcp [uncultured Pseudacidovorax sp.]|jgi:hypothetical protein|uniref:type VI secretion system tube protein Hcp n=1 Tax=uncultured Pseudacidovorax sp. TaxID=679313 RepID=UPI0025D38239|nr:type VI secretion system tube protein Hcp [uncultured Pseudacidovorax sp.]